MKTCGKFNVRKPLEDSSVMLELSNNISIAHQIQADLQVSRTKALATMDDLKTSLQSIQILDAEEILTLQGLLGHGFTFGEWESPQKWVPGLRSDGMLKIDLRRRITHFLEPKHKTTVQEVLKFRSATLNATGIGEARALPPALSQVDHLLDAIVLTATRYLVLCRLGPVGRGGRNKHGPLDPSTLAVMAYAFLPIMMSAALTKCLDDNDLKIASLPVTDYLSRLKRNDFSGLSRNAQIEVFNEVLRMEMLSDMGLWKDVPIFHESLQKITDPSGPVVQPKHYHVVDVHLPLPDDYVAEMGRKTLWIIQELGPNLIEIGAEFLKIWQVTTDLDLKDSDVLHRRSLTVKKYLREYVWRNSCDSIIDALPFVLHLCQHGQKHKNAAAATPDIKIKAKSRKRTADIGAEIDQIDSWPPRTFAHITGLWAVLQRAHLFVVAMSEGPRATELLTKQRDCVQYAQNGMPYSIGRTFKLVERHEGELREWVLPDIAVQALEQQVRLISVAEAVGQMSVKRKPNGMLVPVPKAGNHLWGKIGGVIKHKPHERMVDPAPSLSGYALSLGMSATPGGQNFRFHRFRKTLGRVGALALTQAINILMDVFGHKNIEMTLHYILADKDLQADIRKVTCELQVMRAKDAIETIVAAEDAKDALLKEASMAGAFPPLLPASTNGGFGGGAAPHLVRTINLYRDRVHKQSRDWGANTMQELAERFTAIGMAWDYVQPGVMCIKRHTQAGACTHKVGRRDASNCQTGCDFHLVHPHEREKVDGAIADCLRYYIEAGEHGDDWMQEVWAQQIMTHLSTFDDLHTKWMDNPTVRWLHEEQEI